MYVAAENTAYFAFRFLFEFMLFNCQNNFTVWFSLTEMVQKQSLSSVLSKKVFLKVSQNSQENTSAKDSF